MDAGLSATVSSNLMDAGHSATLSSNLMDAGASPSPALAQAGSPITADQ
jgi:hypothetical protein